MAKVLKFGGTSLGSAERVENVANIVISEKKEGDTIVVVVSAVGGVTDQLLDCARTAEQDGPLALNKIEKIRQRHFDVFGKQLKDEKNLAAATAMFTELQDVIKGVSLVRECSPRTLDFVLSFGERLCAQLMTALLNSKNAKAEYLDARDVVKTDKKHGQAHVLIEETNRLVRQRVTEPHIYVMTGFIASTKDGITTTLGRGGSDYTASLVGAALDAEQIEIWTDVDGFMSADPRIVKDAFVLSHVSYEEAMEMSYFGAKVIHPQTLVPAVKKNIPVLIKNSLAPQNPGTIIAPNDKDFEHPVKGVASFSGISLINIQGGGMVGVPGIANRLFGALAARNISVIMISQASSEHSICFVVQMKEADSAIKAIEEEFEAELIAGKIDRIEKTDDLSIIAAVGENMKGTPGIAGKLFGALGQNSINVIAIAQGSSERNVSLVVNSQDCVKAVNVIHSAFYLSQSVANLFILGTGTIGSMLLKQIKEGQAELLKSKGLLIKVCGLGNMDGMILDEEGIELASWQKTFAASASKIDLDSFLEKIKAFQLPNSIFVDVTASDYIASRYVDFLQAGIHIITPNKKANTMSQEYYDSLKKLTQDHRLHYLYETTVGAGLPIIGTLQNLLNSGDEILKIEGILSGTLSYIFNTLAPDKPLSKVVKQAHQKGLTEPDPREDLSGYDVARKILILAREIGLSMEFQDVKVESVLPEKYYQGDLDSFWKILPEVDEEFEQRRKQAEDNKKRLVYLASLKNGRCEVGIKESPLDHLFAFSGATDNIVQITTKRYFESPLTIHGPGAGREVTAAGILADIINLALHLS